MNPINPNIQQTLQAEATSFFRTGNPIADAMIMSVLIGVIGNLVSYTNEIIKYLIEKIKEYITPKPISESKSVTKTQSLYIYKDQYDIRQTNKMPSGKEQNYFYDYVTRYIDTNMTVKSDTYTVEESALRSQYSFIEDTENMVFPPASENSISTIEYIYKEDEDKEDDEVTDDKEDKGTKYTIYVTRGVKIEEVSEHSKHRYQYYYLEIKNTDNPEILKSFVQFAYNETWLIRNPVIEHKEDYVEPPFNPRLYMNKTEEWTDHGYTNNKKTLECVILDQNRKEKLMEHIEFFLNNKSEYDRTGVPWKLGILLTGPPGTGKTSLIKAISNKCKRHIYYLQLNKVFSDDNLIKLLDTSTKTARNLIQSGILVIEDIDCASDVVLKRKEKETEKKEEKKTADDKILKAISNLGFEADEKEYYSSSFTLSTLLNCLDGVINSEGRIIIMTSNHPEKLDPAIIRPGRIDKIVNLDLCTHDQIKKMYKLFYKTDFPEESLTQLPPEKTISPASLSHHFLRYYTSPETAIKNLSYLLPEAKDDNIIETDSDITVTLI